MIDLQLDDKKLGKLVNKAVERSVGNYSNSVDLMVAPASFLLGGTCTLLDKLSNIPLNERDEDDDAAWRTCVAILTTVHVNYTKMLKVMDETIKHAEDVDWVSVQRIRDMITIDKKVNEEGD